MRQLDVRKNSFKFERKPQHFSPEKDASTLKMCGNEDNTTNFNSTATHSNKVENFLHTPVEPLSRRASSCGAPGTPVRRNSSNRSTNSEGGTRTRPKHPVEFIQTKLQKIEKQSRLAESIGKRDYIFTGAASLLRLVIPSLDRRGSRNSDRKSSLPNEESTGFGKNLGKLAWQSIRNTDSLRRSWSKRGMKKQSRDREDLHIPFPQRSPPPVPSADQMSLASLSSSVAGHTYEQIVCGSESDNDYETCTFLNQLNESYQENLLRDAVSYESVCNFRRTSLESNGSPSGSCFRSNSVSSLPQKSEPMQNELSVYGDNERLAVGSTTDSLGFVDYSIDVEDSDKFYSKKFITIPRGYKCVQFPYSCQTSSDWNVNRHADNYTGNCNSFTSTVSLLKPFIDTAIPEKPGVCTAFAKTRPSNCGLLQNRSFTSTYKWNCGKDETSKDDMVGCERWQLEGEMCQVQEALVERLGTPTVILHRRDQRLHNINGIEKTIQRLRQDARAMAEPEGYSEEANSTHEALDLLNANQVEMVYGLLSMFSSCDKNDMSKRLLAMSSSPDSCIAMRQSGCLPLLIQLLHGGDEVPPTRETRIRAAQALQNIVHSHPDDKRGRREVRVIRLLTQIREYSDYIYEELERTGAGRGPLLENDMTKHPCATMAAIMKLSFDEDHRHAICALGGLHAITEVIRRDHDAHGSSTPEQFCITLRRYAGMALTNLTFGDGTNKSLLCSLRSFMRALVLQLNSPSEELKQVTASILRNLSWRADTNSKISLREVGAVTALVKAALTAQKESTLKVILSAVWNMSSHCSMNKSDICNTDNALAFICSSLTYKSQAKTLSIVENGGGILRNISSHIAMCDDLRQILRDNNSMNVLLTHLRSPSLTVVSNACGTLWNLSARCSRDQRLLWELGAVPMLRSLINSKHKMISMGSSAALKNLLQMKPEGMFVVDQRNGGMPSLQARKQRALVQELDPNLSEICDNIETSPRVSPTAGMEFGFPSAGPPLFHSFGPQTDFMMSESRETVASTHSDKSHDRVIEPLTRRHLNSDHFGQVPNHGTQNRCNDLTWASSPNESDTKGQSHGVKPNSRGDALHSKVSFLDNKYCNGGNKLATESSSRLQSAIDERQLQDADADYTTNFSFRYSEEDGNNAIAVNDSVQMFCTEGTPYETPYPRSNAGSLSDLSDSKQSGKISNRSLPSKEMSDVEIEDINESTLSSAVRPTIAGDPPKLQDEVTLYGIEYTPVSLSRCSSLSSISSCEMNKNIDKELLEDETVTGRVSKNTALNEENQPGNNKEGSIDGSGTGCLETPLMFSRTTSIGSLSSLEVQSIHDDRSSVISDFSRMTSGAISPSDLPDSPSQMTPLTPRRQQKDVLRSEIICSPPMTGFFKETPQYFMEESTPAEFSCSTSLSNLTCDGYEIPLRARSRGDGKESSCTNSDSSQSILAKECSQRTSLIQNGSSLLNSDNPWMVFSCGQSPAQESTEEMRLASLIQSGMPGKRRPLSGTRSVLSSTMHPVPLPPPPPSVPQDGQNQRASSIPIKTANLTVTVESINLATPSDNKPTNTHEFVDTVRNYCTEYTPVDLSDCDSISELPIKPDCPNLSDLYQIPRAPCAGSNKVAKSKKSPNSTEDLRNDSHKRQVLENCIQAGMPKPSNINEATDSVRNYCSEYTTGDISDCDGKPECSSLLDLYQISLATDPGTNNSTKSNKSLNVTEEIRNDSHKRQVLENCIQAGMPKPRPIPMVRSSRQKEKLKQGIPATPKVGIFNTRPSTNQRPVPIARVRPQTITNEIQHRTIGKQLEAGSKLNKIPVFTPKLKGQSNKSFKPNRIEVHNDEIPKKYFVEDTPFVLSRNSSLNSIVDSCERTPKMGIQQYEVENTPVCFSRNSSLSSLSVESADDETALREQAVLQKCIRDGMPKTKSDLGNRRSVSKKVGGSRIPSLRSPGHTPPCISNQTVRHVDISNSGSSIIESNSLGDSQLATEFEEKYSKSSTSDDNRPTIIAAKITNSDTPTPDDRPLTNQIVDITSQSLKTSLERRGSDNSTYDSLALSNEALQMARTVANGWNKNSSQMSCSVGSSSDVGIDEVTPPSIMDNVLSLSNSFVNSNDDKTKPYANVNKRIDCRHTLKPVMLRRTFYDQTDVDSLASSCHSNIDNIPPPTMLVDDDMESSMISVDSITSDVVEIKDSPLSIGTSLNSEMMGEIAGAAQNLANMLLQESLAQSSVTLIPGEEGSTYQDLTELEKDETFGLQNADELKDVPELPFDSPRKGYGQRKPLLKLKERYLSQNSDTSSLDSSRSNSPKSSRQRRAEQPDRFKTRTISFRTIDSSGTTSSSPRIGAAAKANTTKIVKPSSRDRDVVPSLQRQNTFTKEDKKSASFEKKHQRKAPIVQQRGTCRPKNR